MSSGPAHRVQSAVVEYGFPQGHLGHLTTEEEAALNNFKVVCAEKGLYEPGNGSDEPASHEDATLLRFLRARRFVVLDALKQFSDTEEWRKENELDQLYETIDLEHYEETRRLYPQWTGRRDRRGIPVYVFEVSYLTGKRMSAYEKSAVDTHTKTKQDGKTSGKLLRLFALYENLTRFVMPLCTVLTDRDHPRTPITQSNNIVDISGVGLKQFWNLRGHMQDASTLATAHYPETLDRIFVIGAPSFFPTVWGWIKKWFDPITTSKIFIISHNDVKSTLEAFIEPRNIPKKYGGELEFEFGDMPTLDPALEAVTTWNGAGSFPGGPMYWVNTKDQESIQAIAVGSSEKKERREEVCTIKKTIKDNDNMGTIATDATTETPLPVQSETLEVPGATPAVINTTAGSNSPLNQGIPIDDLAIENGEVVSNSRPELETFHTAQDGLTNLSITSPPAEEVLVNGTTESPHTTTTANQLDPNLNHDGAGAEPAVAAGELSKATTQQESIHDEVPALPMSLVAGSETSSTPGASDKKEKRKSLLGGLKGKLTGHH
ncbi:putative sec14 cytosolic factor protein [Botrytis fragariae]|uniref:Putative sec14 cytosolic factor protein n=1 Tax=Botrytis fragariae TaxID=1964551 RepID=A0A8H6EHV1_9HELO|nr:putative sec14 cytosolic factor protein [Botrytis fragariae]KAF5872778.1 putative sec14 cytosolic factor protein [Botrytis fragariae]